MIKAVLFDAGGTLIEAAPSVGDIYSKVASRHGLKIKADELNKRFREAWKARRLEQGSINKEWWKSMVTEIFSPYHKALPEELFNDIYKEFSLPNSWKIFPEVKPVLEKLRKQGIMTAIASNWDDRLPALLNDLKLAPYFDHQFISFDLGFSKPHAQFFKLCLERLGLGSADVIHVGDDPENDGRGPSHVGIRSLLIDRTGSPGKPGEFIRSLEEIFARF